MHEDTYRYPREYGKLQDPLGTEYFTNCRDDDGSGITYEDRFNFRAEIRNGFGWVEEQVNALAAIGQGATSDRHADVQDIWPPAVVATQHIREHSEGNIVVSRHDVRDLGWMDDEISEFRLDPGQGATFYEYPNFQGDSFSLIGDGNLVDLRYDPFTGEKNGSWNDRISSIDLWGVGGPPYRPVSGDGDESPDPWGGWVEAYNIPKSGHHDGVSSYTDIRDLGWMDNRISQIFLPEGTVARFYQYPNFQGASFQKVGVDPLGSWYDLTGDWWDNRISSIDLYPL
jgi:hypothetical protein